MPDLTALWKARCRYEDQPRSLRDPAAVEYRRSLLREPHMEALTSYTAKLRGHGRGEVPEFDPFDGGSAAQILFLFEKPGPMTDGLTGSGFISRDNDDPSAEATFRFMRSAGISRKLTVTWNVIPWWNGTRRIAGSELAEGIACVHELIALLPKLSTVVLVGRKAARAAHFFDAQNLSLFTSAHPSPLVRARYPERWLEIPSQWAKALEATDG